MIEQINDLTRTHNFKKDLIKSLVRRKGPFRRSFFKKLDSGAHHIVASLDSESKNESTLLITESIDQGENFGHMLLHLNFVPKRWNIYTYSQYQTVMIMDSVFYLIYGNNEIVSLQEYYQGKTLIDITLTDAGQVLITTQNDLTILSPTQRSAYFVERDDLPSKVIRFEPSKILDLSVVRNEQLELNEYLLSYIEDDELNLYNVLTGSIHKLGNVSSYYNLSYRNFFLVDYSQRKGLANCIINNKAAVFVTSGARS